MDAATRRSNYVFKKPRSSGKINTDTTRNENWIELLIDLFYIAYMLKLTNVFVECGIGRNRFIYSASIFLGMYMAKFEMDQYMNKFANEDFVHKVFFTIYSFGIFVMTMNVNSTAEHATADQLCPEYQPYSNGFAAGWVITRVILLVMYYAIYHYVRPQGPYIFYAKGPVLIGSIAIMIANFFVGTSRNYFHNYLVMAAALFELLGFGIWQVLIVGDWVRKNKGVQMMVPVNIWHQSMRTSSFLMIVLGANVIMIVLPITTPTVEYNACLLMGFGILFLLSIHYFDIIPGRNAPHALGRSRLQGTTWMFLHPLLSFFLFGSGVALRLLYDDIAEGDDTTSHRHMFGSFLGMSVFFTLLVRLTHKDVSMISVGGKLTSLMRVMVAALHIFLTLGIDGFKYRQTDLFKESGTFRPLTLASNVKTPRPMKQVESLIEIKRGANMRSQNVDVRLPIEGPIVPPPRKSKKKSSRRLEEKAEERPAEDKKYVESDTDVAELADLHVMSPAPSIELDRASSLQTEKSFHMTSPVPGNDNVVTTRIPPPEVAVLR